MTPSLKLDKLETWVPGSTTPMLVAGPCSAESRDQVLATAMALKQNGLNPIFRCGVWKPRTRPNNFEGVGPIAFHWLKEVKEKTGFKIAVEAANSQQVEMCLKNSVDVIWIGARTTVNPFYVQEIADALRGVDIPVLVKNPVSPDLKLWIGALERLNQAGICKLVAVHRGFHSIEDSPFRNPPLWEIPADLKVHFPQLPILCDPSHITGTRLLLASVSQRAFDLGMAGLMVETHIDPASAWSDAEQQVTPEELHRLLSRLQLRNLTTSDRDANLRLEQLRREIDSVDQEILSYLASRISKVREIGELKQKNGVSVLQVDRWQELLTDRIKMGQRLGLEADSVKELFQTLHSLSIDQQFNVSTPMNNLEPSLF